MRRIRVAMWSSLKRSLEAVGVLLVDLELVDELDLAVEQRLVAAGQVHEHVADALAEQGRLLGGDLDRDVLDRGHGLAEVLELGAAAGLDVGDRLGHAA